MKTAGPPYRSLNPMASERVLAKRAALRLRIIEEALAAFAARGFEATTMTDIADRLQMTGPALYHYSPPRMRCCSPASTRCWITCWPKSPRRRRATSERAHSSAGARRARAGGARNQARLGRVAGQCASVQARVT